MFKDRYLYSQREVSGLIFKIVNFGRFFGRVGCYGKKNTFVARMIKTLLLYFNWKSGGLKIVSILL